MTGKSKKQKSSLDIMKHKFILLTIMLMIMAIPHHAIAEYDFSAVAPTGQTLYYTVVNSSEVSVTYPESDAVSPYSEFSRPTGDLSIPSTVTNDGTTYSVTSIGEYAFYYCSGLSSVIIPNSVTSIGESAFFYCSGLTSLTLPNSVTSIRDYTFHGCSGLTSLTIPNSVTLIGNSAFNSCYGLASLTIGDSVSLIGDYAFATCYNLTSLTLPNSVTSMGELAFYGCSHLTEINCLSATAPTLGNDVFGGVERTIPVNIPCGSSASYQSEWWYFSNFNEVFSPYTFNVFSSDEVMGNASITTLPDCANNTAVIEAIAYTGYIFDHWNDGATENPYTVHLTSDTTLIAYFAINTGIDDMDDSEIRVYARDRLIHIDAAVGETVNVYTIDGRTIATLPKATEHVAIPVISAGVYLVRIGSHPARKVVVIQ